MVSRRLGDRTIAAGIAMLTAVLGALRAGRPAFWLDEAYTASAAEKSWGGLVHFLGKEGGMGPYYLTLWGWAHLGHSQGWLRMWSVVGAALALAATFLFAARYVGRVAGIAACMSLLCNSIYLYNLIELRAYSWSMCLAVVSTMLFLRLREQPSARNAVLYGAAVGLMLGVLMFTVGVVLAQIVVAGPLLKERAGRLRLALAATVAAVLFAPSVPALLSSNQLSWIPKLTPHTFGVNIVLSLGGYKWLAILAVGNAVLLATFVRRPWRRADDTALRIAFVSVVVTPIIVAALCLVQQVFMARYLTPTLPFAAVGAVAGYARLIQLVAVPEWARRIGLGIAVGLVVIGVWVPITFDMQRPEDMRAPAALLTAEVRPGDAVVFNVGQVYESVVYYWHPVGTVYEQDVPGRAFDPHTTTPCHVWYYYRATTNEVLQAIGRSGSDPNVLVHAFRGYTVAEVDTCPG